jgi:cytochrome c-type biogenesis protein CcmH/NrfG
MAASFWSRFKLNIPKEKIDLIPRISSGILLATAFALPILILPIGENFLIDSKILFFLYATIAITLLWTILSFARKTLQLTLSPFMIPFGLLLVSTLLSTFFNSIYPITQLVGLGGLSIASALLVLFAPSLVLQKIGKLFPITLIVSLLLLSLTGTAELLHAGPSVVINALSHLSFPSSPLFSLSGSALIAFELIAVGLTGSIAMLFSDKKMLKPFFLLASVILAIGLFVNGRALLQQKLFSNVLPPFGASWSIATDTLKSVKSTMIGVGPENYQQMYLRYKPAWINTTEVWNAQFSQGSNMPLTLLVTHGLFGLIAWFIFVGISFQQLRKTTKEGRPFAVMVIASIIIEFILPPNVVLIALQALCIVFWIVTEKNRFQDAQLHAFTVVLVKSAEPDEEVKKIPKHLHVFVYIVTGLLSVLLAFCMFWLALYTYSQFYIFRAGTAAVRSDVLNVYTYQQKAIVASPYFDNYHRLFANTNMVVAQVLAQKQDLQESEKQQILSLMNTAINESKIASRINPNNSLNWLSIARTYNNLLGVSEGADTLAASAYTQALFLAPTDPTMNLELGNLYLRSGQFPQAVFQLEKTVQLKPNWANAFYNLANAYKQNKQFALAAEAYQKTLSLLPVGDESNKVKAELDELSKLVAKPTSQGPQSEQ